MPDHAAPLAPEDRARLDALVADLERLAATAVGYPTNQAFRVDELVPFLRYSVNNVGDPFQASNYRQNTHALEREVIAEAIGLCGGDAHEAWGYVTTGGTEGNLFALHLARELLPDGVVYYSEATHYSVPKILGLLGVRSIMLRADARGEMDYADLAETLRIHRHVPPIVFANIGTTMTGAVDDVRRIGAILDRLAIPRRFVHADAALSGMVLPFLDDPPGWSFADGADSISVSGHKMLGSPVPCGLVLARRRHVDRIARSVEYVGAVDATIGGSRSGIAPLVLWLAFRRLGHDGLRDLAAGCIATAEHAVQALVAAGIPAWRHPHSITVVFPRPPAAFLDRWTVAVHGPIGHIVCVGHVTRDLIDRFAADLADALHEGAVA